MEQYETMNFVVFSDEHGGHGHGVHVAGWQYDYVKTPLLITIFLIVALISKLGFHHVECLSKFMPESW